MSRHLRPFLAFALTLLFVPAPASASLRGVWDFITNGSVFNSALPSGSEQPALRPGATYSTGGHDVVEQWFAFTTRSRVVGRETSRSIWLGRNQDQAGFKISNILDARRSLLIDPTALVSYTDPAWSPDGRYLAYVQTDAMLSQTSIYVQEYLIGDDMATAATAVGDPILVIAGAPGQSNRNPVWSPAGGAIAYSSLAAGPSQDIWTIAVDPASRTVGDPLRVTFDNAHSETNPSWGPDGRIVYVSNRYGPTQLEIVDISDGSVVLAELNFTSISHRNPSWAPDGASIYYEAPQDEKSDLNPDIWRLDLATQSKCDIYLDSRGDADPDVSHYTNTTIDGIPYNLFLMSSQAAGFGVCVWRGSAVSCAPALPIGVDISPTTLNLGGQGKNLTVTVTMPPESRAAGYRAIVDKSDHGKGIPDGVEGVKNRNTILVSPTFLGMSAPTSEINGSPYAAIDNVSKGGEEAFQMNMERKAIEAYLVGLGLVDRKVECRVTAYSALRGRQFVGYAYLRLASNTTSGQTALLQQNAPNPFNPMTSIRFSLAKPGQVTVRVFNVRGELVATVARGYYDEGAHEATWNGTSSRGKVASGVYFARADAVDETGAEISSNVIKMVLAE